jgi:hypothetical protein
VPRDTTTTKGPAHANATYIACRWRGTGIRRAAQAQDVITFDFDGSFDDATFAVESAILDRGLVIDLMSHVGDMLNRTGGDVGSEQMVFDECRYLPVLLGRDLAPGDGGRSDEYRALPLLHLRRGDGREVTIGHRAYPDGPMQEVEAMLDSIILDARGR